MKLCQTPGFLCFMAISALTGTFIANCRHTISWNKLQWYFCINTFLLRQIFKIQYDIRKNEFHRMYKHIFTKLHTHIVYQNHKSLPKILKPLLKGQRIMWTKNSPDPLPLDFAKITGPFDTLILSFMTRMVTQSCAASKQSLEAISMPKLEYIPLYRFGVDCRYTLHCW